MNLGHLLLRLFFPLLICTFVHTTLAADPDSLIIARAGGIPILLTVPHGGTASVSGVSQRVRGTTSSDTYTIELAEGLAKHLGIALGAQPYVVAARFSRKYIDANRAEAEAFESPEAKPAYDAYHNQIRLFISQIKEQFPQGALLLDVHGQSDDPGVVHRGTGNGATVAALIKNHGPSALSGPNSIFGVVQSKGYKVFPQNTPIGEPPEDRRFNGGYTVRRYGSSRPDGLDAIQIEPGRYLRTDSKFIAALAEGIVTFHKTYLAPKR